MSKSRGRIKIQCNDLYMDGRDIWFSNAEMNGLFRKCPNRTDAEFICFFPGEDLWQEDLHGTVIHYKNKLLFTPLYAEQVSVYDLEKGTFSVYQANWSKEGLEGKVKFFWSVLHENYVYMFGYYKPCIFKFNIDNGEYQFIDGWFESFCQFGYRKEREFFSEKSIRLEDRLYLFTKQNQILIEFRLKDEQVIYHKVGNREEQFITAEYANRSFWFLTKRGELIEWSKENGLKRRIAVDLESDFYRCFCYRQYIVLLPSGKGNMSVFFDTLTGKIAERVEIESPAQIIKEYLGKISYYSKKDSMIYRLNEKKFEAAEFFFTDASVLNLFIWKELNQKGKRQFYENEKWGLTDYLTAVRNGEPAPPKEQCQNFFGAGIHQSICKELFKK